MNNKSKRKSYAVAVKKLQRKLIKYNDDQVLQVVLDVLDSLHKGMEEQKESINKIFHKFTKEEDINKQIFQRLATMKSSMDNFSSVVRLIKND